MKRQIITVPLLVSVIIGVWGCSGKIPKIEMVLVKGGTFFTMGCTPEQGDDCRDNEKPSSHVLVDDFYISKYEVTQRQWKKVMNFDDNPWERWDRSWLWKWMRRAGVGDSLTYFNRKDLPVTMMSWRDTQRFIEKLNSMTGKNYRLPTEAEWEYAARGGKKSKGYKYSGSNNIDNVAWYYENSGDGLLDETGWNADTLISNRNRIHPVGTKSPNELGIYDMSGNVWEWVSDNYDDYTAEPKTNPQGSPLDRNKRRNIVFRGGGWASGAEFCRVSNRGGNKSHFSECNLGFRLALDP